MPIDNKYPGQEDEFKKKDVIPASALLGGGGQFGSYGAPSESRAPSRATENYQTLPIQAPSQSRAPSKATETYQTLGIPSATSANAPKYPAAGGLSKGASPMGGFSTPDLPTWGAPTIPTGPEQPKLPELGGSSPKPWGIEYPAPPIPQESRAETGKSTGWFQNIRDKVKDFVEPQENLTSQGPLVRPAAVAGVPGFEPNIADNFVPREVQSEAPETYEYQTLTPPAETLPADATPVDTTLPAEITPPEDLSLTAPDAVTDLGSFVEDETLRGLQTGEFAGIQSQANRTDRNRSTRDYMINKQARERAANSGFAPGTKQYQDIMAQAQSEISRGNLAGEQALNQATRDEFQTYMDRAQGIETQKFGQAVGERGLKLTRDDVKYLRDKEGKVTDKADANNVINNIKDQKAKQALLEALNTGGIDAFNAKLSEVIGDSGTIDPRYRSSSTIETMFQEAEEWVNRLNPKTAGETDEAYAARTAPMVNERMKELDAAKQQPITEGAKIADEEAALSTRLDTALDSGNFTSLTKEDWTQLNGTQRSKLKSQSVTWESLGVTEDYGDGWDDEDMNPDNYSDSEAKRRYLAKTPTTVGQIISKGGKIYIVIDPARVSSAGDNKRIKTVAIDTSTGEEANIQSSWKYE